MKTKSSTRPAPAVTKHILILLVTSRGEYEFTSHLLREVSPETDPWTEAEEAARTFYGDDGGEPDGSGYLFNGGELYVKADGVQEITPKQAATLRELGIG